MRTVGVVGATGLVGREICRLLETRAFPVDDVRLFASPRSAGSEMTVAGRRRRVEDVDSASLGGVDLAFFSAGSETSRRVAPRFVAAGAWVVDNSSAFRQDDAVPLVLPEVNGEALKASESRVIANPNCTTIILLMPVAPLHRRFGVRRVVVSSYQAVSGSGKAGVDELDRQARAYAVGEEPVVSTYDRPIHMNVIPLIGEEGADGFCEEERKMVLEARKILGAPGLDVLPTTVRVPVVRCHSESVYVELARPASREEILAVWREMPGLTVASADSAPPWPSPRELAGREETFVGRLRGAEGPHAGRPRTRWTFWVVGDQLLKGAALNAVQIGERLVSEGHI